MKINLIIFFLTALVSIEAYSQEVSLDMLSSLTPEQIQAAKDQFDTSLKSDKPAPVVSESTKKTETPRANNDFNKYGYDYFSSIPTTIAAVGDLPLPNEYKISLKDQFTIILSGSKEEIFDLDVNLDGTILFPELGSISVVGETLKDVKEKLISLIEQSYIGVQIDVSLKNLAAKKITIVGAVNTPGTYLVNPFSTISSALAYSGGILEIGTLRKIRLVRASGEVYFFDLYELLINGNRDNDITVEAGDVIVIDAANQFVKLSGEIKRPAIYEVVDGEMISDLIAFGLGFTNIANKTNIDLDVLDVTNSAIKNIVTADLSKDLLNSLSVNVNPYKNKNLSSIRVDGAVKEPGFYSLSNYKNLESLVNDIEFINVYPWLAVLEQFDEEKLKKETILFSLKDKDTYTGIDLLPNSKVFFSNRDSREFVVEPSTSSLIEDYSLKINIGRESYLLPVFGNFVVKSIIDFLGFDTSDLNPLATYISPLQNMVVEENFAEMSFVAEKFHTITFKSPINDLITVNIEGALDYPGTYTLQSDSTLLDLYQIVGGFKSEAFLNGIIFTRESVRQQQLKSLEVSKAELNNYLSSQALQNENLTPENLDILRFVNSDIEPKNLGRIAGDFSPKNENITSIILSNGDSIFVPVDQNFVSVLGEVFNPLAFEFNSGVNIDEAIRNAGGFKNTADKKNVYIIKSNGLIQMKGRNIFAKNYKLEPGDTIVVPRKVQITNQALNAILPITQIISDLSFSAAAIESLSNSNN